MNILILTPSLNIHGGIRVLVEWANHLHRRGHDVTLQVETGPMQPPGEWIDIDSGVSVATGQFWNAQEYDIAVAGTPNIANRLDPIGGVKKFLLLQMAEDLFAPHNRAYVNDCHRSYTVQMPIIGISKWVEQHVRAWRPDHLAMHYIGNGVSEHFQPGKKDVEFTVLAEGWEGYNPAKDTKQFTARCAHHLKEKYGIRVIAYSQFPMSHHTNVPDQYYRAPGTDEIRTLYQRAHMMIKATRFDARSCAPVEAMACGTPTARAIDKGDDDLINEYNCLKVDYNLDQFIAAAERMVEDDTLREKLTRNGLEYRKKYLSWDYWMDEVEKIFSA